MFKKLIAATIAATASVLPVSAEIQPGTQSLLETMSENGILITINHDECLTNGANGTYRWLGFQREMRLCPGDTVDAIDHATVRHETIHAIQHCVNVARGTHTDTPVITDNAQLRKFVLAWLPPATIESIYQLYDESQWLTELEAFAGANAYTSAELEDYFLQACVAGDN